MNVKHSLIQLKLLSSPNRNSCLCCFSRGKSCEAGRWDSAVVGGEEDAFQVCRDFISLSIKSDRTFALEKNR